jgi:hypothetical protein
MKLLRTAVQRAKTAGRELSAAEWQEVTRQNYGMVPPDLDDPKRPVPKPTIQYEWMKIAGDHASVRFDPGPALEEADLIKINGRWYITRITISMVLIVVWAVTTITIPIDHRTYLTLTAPLWHMALHAAWIVSLLVTNTLGVYLYWELRSRRRHQADQQS